MRRLIALEHHAFAQQRTCAVCTRQLRPARQRNVRRRVFQTGRLHDVVRNEIVEAFAGDRLDHQSGKSEAMVGIFEPRPRIDDRRLPSGRAATLSFVEELAAPFPVGRVRSVAHDAGGVGQQLGNGRALAMAGWRPDTYAPAWSSSDRRSFSRSRITAAAVNDLECDATRKRCRGVSFSSVNALA